MIWSAEREAERGYLNDSKFNEILDEMFADFSDEILAQSPRMQRIIVRARLEELEVIRDFMDIDGKRCTASEDWWRNFNNRIAELRFAVEKTK